MFSQECVGNYARFHDVIHTLQRMDDPPWDYTVVPLRRYYGEPSHHVLFQNGSAPLRLINYLHNLAYASREADVVHVVQGDLISSLPPLVLVPPDKQLVAGPNVTTFFYPAHVVPLWIAGGTDEQVKDPLPFPSNRLSFLGYLDRQELAKYFRSCDIFVNSSRFEVDGTTSVEALACGTPVIGSDLPSFAAKNHFNISAGERT